MKKLGQYFLKNKSAIGKIIATLDLKDKDVILEIGPGHGELTEIIEHEALNLKQKIKIITIEKDRKLAELLKNKLCRNPEIEIIAGDALIILPKLCSTLRASSFKICGNIPYYITGHLLRLIGELENKPALCVFTMQKEVADRLAASPPGMNRLAASVQVWAEPFLLARLPREDFFPQPNVDSAIIKLVQRNTENMWRETKSQTYYRAVRALFAQPRKTILNNMASRKSADRGEIAKKLRGAGINPLARPQDLTIENILKAAQLFFY